jgi:hypothetical protein
MHADGEQVATLVGGEVGIAVARAYDLWRGGEEDRCFGLTTVHVFVSACYHAGCAVCVHSVLGMRE